MATATRTGDSRNRVRPSRDQIDPAAVELLDRHGAQLMATARRYAATPEDAEDAYQRGVEILLTKAPTTDPAELLPWLKTVVKHEAFAVRRQAERNGVPSEPADIEPHAGRDPGPSDLAERRERLRVGAEAMNQLKPQEIRALMLRADGLSYQEICETTGWTYTKVNRCLSEGRRSFVERVAGIETGVECARITPLLSALADGEATADDLARLRPHLRGCLACRARLREYREAPSRVAAVAPLGFIGSLSAAVRAVLGSRWESFGQVVAANKGAAVAASTLALAGSGAATVATLPHAPVKRHASGLQKERRALRLRDAAAGQTRSVATRHRARHPTRSAASKGQFVLTPAAAADPASSSRSSGSTAPATSSPSRSGSSTPASSAPAQSAPAASAPPAAPSGGGGAGGGEFAP